MIILIIAVHAQQPINPFWIMLLYSPHKLFGDESISPRQSVRRESVDELGADQYQPSNLVTPVDTGSKNPLSAAWENSSHGWSSRRSPPDPSRDGSATMSSRMLKPATPLSEPQKFNFRARDFWLITSDFLAQGDFPIGAAGIPNLAIFREFVEIFFWDRPDRRR